MIAPRTIYAYGHRYVRAAAPRPIYTVASPPLMNTDWFTYGGYVACRKLLTPLIGTLTVKAVQVPSEPDVAQIATGLSDYFEGASTKGSPMAKYEQPRGMSHVRDLHQSNRGVVGTKVYPLKVAEFVAKYLAETSPLRFEKDTLADVVEVVLKKLRDVNGKRCFIGSR